VSEFGVKVTETGSRSFDLIKRYPGFKHPAPREPGKDAGSSIVQAAWPQRRGTQSFHLDAARAPRRFG